MLRLAADENLSNNIVRGLLRRRRELDIVRGQDVGLSGAGDAAVVEAVSLISRGRARGSVALRGGARVAR